MKDKKPNFVRQDSHRWKNKKGSKWRRPKGIQSKMRLRKAASGKPQAELGLSDLQKTLSVLGENQRKRVLADDKVFSDFVKQEAGKASILAAARANKIHQSEKTLIVAQRGVDNIVRELYLNQLVASKVPADFPTDEQIQEYYDKNKEKFVIDERIHVWQIYLPLVFPHPDFKYFDVNN